MAQSKRCRQITVTRPATAPWYAAGLRFTCTHCGNCCSGDPGYVYVTGDEIRKIAASIGCRNGRLSSKHIRKVGPRFSLVEDEETGDCCFLDTKNGKRVCTIYSVRPLQCRTWPFWKINLESADDWCRAAQDCPGINTGKLHDLDEIEVRRKITRC